jgi:hypothetical protein
MILSRTFFIRATSPRLVILRASDEDARRILTYRIVSEFPTFPGCKWEGKR